MTGSAEPSSDKAAAGNPCRRYGAAVRSAPRSARRGAVPVTHPGDRDARPVTTAVTAPTGGPGPIEQPVTGMERPAAQREQDGIKSADPMRGNHNQTSHPGVVAAGSWDCFIP
jgi:hypothetical protein